jgi:nucleoid DNA-binding protein
MLVVVKFNVLEVMMKHIIRDRVASEAGITEPQAERAVEAVMDYFKTRLPTEMNIEIESLLVGEDRND